MAYKYTHFDDVALPIYDHDQDHSPIGGADAFGQSIGGYFLQYGEDDPPSLLQPISVAGVVHGETTYWVDEAGNRLVDEAGNYVIAGTAATMLRSQLLALRAKVRKTGTLWRTRLDDDVREWKTAYFARMRQPQTQQDLDFKSHVTCEFTTEMVNWHAEDQSSVTGFAVDGEPLNLVVVNSGATIDDAVVTITRNSGTISNVAFSCAELGISWTWGNGLTLVGGESLIVDAGTSEVTEGATGAFGGFSVLDGTSPGWMTIETGTWLFEVTVTGGNADVEISWYHQTP